MVISLRMDVRGARRVDEGPQPGDERVGLAGRHPGERAGQQVQAEHLAVPVQRLVSRRGPLTRPGLRLAYPSSIPMDFPVSPWA